MNELLKTRPMTSYNCEGTHCTNPIDALHGSGYLRGGKFYCGNCYKNLPAWLKYPDDYPAPIQGELNYTKVEE